MAMTTVEQLIESLADATSRGDAAAMASHYHPNASHMLAGRWEVGRGALERHLQKFFVDAVPPDIRFEVTMRHVHLVTPTLAIIDSAGTNYRTSEDGQRDLVSREAFTAVAVREGKEWLFAAARGSLPPKDDG